MQLQASGHPRPGVFQLFTSPTSDNPQAYGAWVDGEYAAACMLVVDDSPVGELAPPIDQATLIQVARGRGFQLDFEEELPDGNGFQVWMKQACQ